VLGHPFRRRPGGQRLSHLQVQGLTGRDGQLVVQDGPDRCWLRPRWLSNDGYRARQK